MLLRCIILLAGSADALSTSSLHRAVRSIQDEHVFECDVASARYQCPAWVERADACIDAAVERGGYRDEDVWSAESVFSAADTASLVAEINAQEQGWSTDRHASWQKSGGVKDLPLPFLPGATAWLAEHFKSTVAPLVARVLPDLVGDAADLRVADAFVVQYVAGECGPGEEASLPPHVDGGLVSVNIGLNAAFDGGGTRFEHSGSVVGGGDGSVAIHPSAVRHAGEPIRAGVRLILVVFCISTKAPELCRRFVRQGLDAERCGDKQGALLAFRRAARFDGGDVVARHNLGTQRLVVGGWDNLAKACSDFHRCICLAGGEECQNVHLIGAFGETLQSLGSYAEALDVSAWVLRLAPRDFVGCVMRAKAVASLLHDGIVPGDGRQDSELRSALADADSCARTVDQRAEFAKLCEQTDALFAA